MSNFLRHNLVRAVTLTFAVAFSLCAPAGAQIAPGVQNSAQKTAVITGVVLDTKGAPVNDADVLVRGANASLRTKTDASGSFQLLSIPYGTYTVFVDAPHIGRVQRNNVVISYDTTLTIQYAVQEDKSGLATIAHVSTSSSGAHINVTPANIASVNPTDYAFNGNVSWQQMLNAVPGVTVGGGLFGGGTTNAFVPNSPFVPIILSINGAMPYETATTLDGMPLSNTSFGSTPGAGVNLSSLPMPMFETADVVRGPGANSPTILDSVGGSFVLHPPGIVEKTAFDASFSNDQYGGFFGNTKAAFKLGKLSGTVAYGFNNSPGPFGIGSVFGQIVPNYINGKPVASGIVTFESNPKYQQCYCNIKTTLLGVGGLQSTEWSAHNGGIGLAYRISPSVTAQAFYAASQDTMSQADNLYNGMFSPGATYKGAYAPGAYQGRTVSNTVTPILQSGSLWEEKISAYLSGNSVLRVAALQNYTYTNQTINSTPTSAVALYGTGNYCNDAACSSLTPFTFNGQVEKVSYDPFTYIDNGRSINRDFLASYDSQIGADWSAGVSWVKSSTAATDQYLESAVYSGQSATFSGGIPLVTDTGNEWRIHAGTRIADRLTADLSYYITNTDYHIPNPVDPSGNTWTDARFSYGAPRLGLAYNVNRNLVVRGSAGGGLALPPLYSLVGTDGPPSCSPTDCVRTLTNINLLPETSFGVDVGTDARINRDTSVSLDLYRTNLWGQLYQSQTFAGIDPQHNLPVYNVQTENLGQSRYEGLNLAVKRDVASGVFWSGGLGLTRGYIVSVPDGFYNQAGHTCNFKTAAGCTNLTAVVGPNFNGAVDFSTFGGFYDSAIPYANGNATVGYRWANKKYIDVQANYQGNNNAYFQSAFTEFNADASWEFYKGFSIIVSWRNVTGIHAQSYAVLSVDPNHLAPAVAGTPYPLTPLPWGPQGLVVTSNFSF